MVKKIILAEHEAYKKIKLLKTNDEVMIVNSVIEYNQKTKNNMHYGQFIKVKILDNYNSKDFENQYSLLPDIIKPKKDNLMYDLNYEDQENYLDILKSLCEKIKDKTLLKLFGLSHTEENFKELSKDLMKMRLRN